MLGKSGKTWTERLGGKKKNLLQGGMIGKYALIARRWPLPALRVGSSTELALRGIVDHASYGPHVTARDGLSLAVTISALLPLAHRGVGIAIERQVRVRNQE
jgi:hypothetical protein